METGMDLCTWHCDICGKGLNHPADIFAIFTTVTPSNTGLLDVCKECKEKVDEAVAKKIFELSHGNLTIERIED